MAAVVCGVAVYMTGYAFGELDTHRNVTKMYTQGYKTGFIKGFRRHQKEVMIQVIESKEDLDKIRLNLQPTSKSIVRNLSGTGELTLDAR